MSGIVEANVSFLADQLACGFSRVLRLLRARVSCPHTCFLLHSTVAVRNELTADTRSAVVQSARHLSAQARPLLGINDDGNAMNSFAGDELRPTACVLSDQAVCWHGDHADGRGDEPQRCAENDR